MIARSLSFLVFAWKKTSRQNLTRPARIRKRVSRHTQARREFAAPARKRSGGCDTAIARRDYPLPQTKVAHCHGEGLFPFVLRLPVAEGACPALTIAGAGSHTPDGERGENAENRRRTFVLFAKRGTVGIRRFVSSIIIYYSASVKEFSEFPKFLSVSTRQLLGVKPHNFVKFLSKTGRILYKKEEKQEIIT